MALGITFIYSIMKMINWAMGEFFMIGSYVQYVLIVTLLGRDRWWLALPRGHGLGVPSRSGDPAAAPAARCTWAVIERRDEYATIVTIALMVFFRNLAIVLGGPNQYAPPDYARAVHPRHAADLGQSLRGADRDGGAAGALPGHHQEDVDRPGAARRRAESCRHPDRRRGRPPTGHDRLRGRRGAGRGAPGALLAPDFLVYPENGSISTFKGFEIIVIGGLRIDRSAAWSAGCSSA